MHDTALSGSARKVLPDRLQSWVNPGTAPHLVASNVNRLANPPQRLIQSSQGTTGACEIVRDDLIVRKQLLPCLEDRVRLRSPVQFQQGIPLINPAVGLLRRKTDNALSDGQGFCPFFRVGRQQPADLQNVRVITEVRVGLLMGWDVLDLPRPRSESIARVSEI